MRTGGKAVIGIGSSRQMLVNTQLAGAELQYLLQPLVG